MTVSKLVLTLVLAAAMATAAAAQTVHKPRGGPFGTDWAKPSAETGGYIYNDPRIKDRRPGAQDLQRRAPICPPGRSYNAVQGRCV